MSGFRGASDDAGVDDAVILFTANMERAVQEIASYPGAHVSIQLTKSLLVAHFPPGFDVRSMLKSSSCIGDHLVAAARTLDSQSHFMLQACGGSRLKREASDALQGLKWDTPGYHPPGKDDALVSTSVSPALQLSSGTPTSLRMTGKIAVGVVIVSGQPTELQFTDAERIKVTQQVTNALDFLAVDELAANITFSITWKTPTVPSNELVKGAGMSEIPSAVVFNGKVYCFYQGLGGNEELWYSVFDGSGWAPSIKVPNTGITKWPGAVVYKNKIYCFHSGVTSSKGDLWYNVFTGQGWEGDKKVPNTKISDGPSCVVFQDKLYCFHQGGGANNELWYNVFDGSNWEGDKRIATSYITSGPSAVLYDRKLYYFYRGSNNELWYNVFNGTRWEGDAKVPNTNLSATPSCMVFQGMLHCFHQGTSNNGQLWCNVFSGNLWKGDLHVADVSMSTGPSAVGFGGQVYCFYQGARQNGELLYRTFDNHVSYESIWRDPALRSLGFAPTYNGCVQFANHLKHSSGADWSYVSFFTKYPLYHFAYAGGVRLCMQYGNDGWGPDQINKVFAHETCHIFGAADEYGTCGCGPSGFYNVNNGNCRNCTSNQVSCLMDRNELQICTYSRGQIGWLPRTGLFVFHQGYATNNQMYHTVFDGQAWWRDKLVPATGMSAGPGAIMVDNDIYVFHSSSGKGNEIWYNVFVDGRNWKGDAKVPNTGTSVASPSAVFFNNNIYCFHAASDGKSLWYNVLDRAGNWAGDKQIPNTGSSLGPAATIFNGKIYCFHQGEKYNGELWYNVFNGNGWQGDKRVASTMMSAEPAVVIYNKKLYCFHQGGSDNGQLWYNVFDGVNWEGDKQVLIQNIGGMSEGPSVAILQDKLFCFFQGSNRNGELWYMVFDAAKWSPAQQVPRTGMTFKPSVVCASFTN